MALFKCKMCGGTIEIEKGSSVGICDSCGTKQTLPRIDNEKKANLYDRANHFRRNNDYDKAMSIYEQILNEDTTDAESYWSIVLCRYGIEYVEDTATRKRIPTINRTQFTSIYADEDYKSAIINASIDQKILYEDEAKVIDDIQKRILDISTKEDPFDVFICYKETDANGRRTQDSVLANDLYHQLTQEGFKVFFSRITLEDKLGVAYEPYIFSALNSAKVMVVIGTKPEYFNAVWVKNEWSRYIALIKSGEKKMIVPAYRDMNPYDLPEEFSHLQAQDMSKLGFMQDLIRGIKKIVSIDNPKAPQNETIVAGNNYANTSSLLERAFIFLEDGKWQDANTYCEKVLDVEPKNAEAYLGKLMSELQVKNRKLLANCTEPFDDKDNYNKVLRFGDEKIGNEMRNYIKDINERKENARKTGIYNNAVNAMSTANSRETYNAAANLFKTVSGFKDADSLAQKCIAKAEECYKNPIYSKAKAKMTGEEVAPYEEAITLFKTISGWKDSNELIIECQKKVDTIQAEKDAQEKKEQENTKRLKAIDREISGFTQHIWNLELSLPKIGLFGQRKKEEINSQIKNLSNQIASVILKNKEFFVKELEFIIIQAITNSYRYEKQEEYIKLLPINVQQLINPVTIFFGKHVETIKWSVLDMQEDRVLLISEKAIDCKQYNKSLRNVTWENCALRKWLNGYFLNTAFSVEEQKKILDTKVVTDLFQDDYGSKKIETVDKVFLLSQSEVEKYFQYSSAECKAVKFGKIGGVYETWDVDCNKWWLRNTSSKYPSIVYGGKPGFDFSFNCSFGVRPAMWITLD